MVGAKVAKLVIEEGHWSCSPESVSGHVQIFKFAIENLNSGRVQIFYFQLKNKNLDASRFFIFN